MAAWLKVLAVLAGLTGVAAVGIAVGVVPKPPLPGQLAAPAKPEPVPQPAPEPQVAAKVPEPAPAAAPAPAQEVARLDPAPTAQAPVEVIEPPSFDVVRVMPSGEVVVAGRAAPISSVALLRNGSPHDQAKADQTGLFAMVPPNLPVGTHDLTLLMTLPDGRTIPSKQSVAVSVPADSNGEVVVALASPDKPTEILSLPAAKPAPAAAAASASGERAGATLTSVEVEESGRFYATGHSAPGAAVRLYLNDTFLAMATAGADGKWSFAINKGFEPGSYKVRVDDVDLKTGKVLSRAEVPFDFAPRVASRSGAKVAVATGGQTVSGAGGNRPAGQQVASADASATGIANVVVDEIRTTAVSRGDSLWRISKRVYGNGLRYTTIYEANQKQIRDPRLIYPGQLFVLPGDKPN